MFNKCPVETATFQEFDKMLSLDNLCLQWANFEIDMGVSLKELRKDTDFSDVTLVCEDGQQIEAHRFVLATGSIFFQNLLKTNSKHGHPLIYMRGLKYETLKAVVDFLYCGEVTVPHQSVESFLMVAEDLKLRGVSETVTSKSQGGIFENISKIASVLTKNETIKTEGKEDKNNMSSGEFKRIDTHATKEEVVKPAESVLISRYDYQELEDKIKSMMMPGTSMRGKKRLYVCKVCEKEGQWGNIKIHIENCHIEGIAHPCDFCEMTFKSDSSLRSHHDRKHKKL